ncbi:MAG: PAS domain-containing protein, partial [Proteobacteria bacterium]|nr:PAS domain-containing protein [Pseudomonadota bacterium]
MPDNKMTKDELLAELDNARRLLIKKDEELVEEAARKYDTVRDQSRVLDAFFNNSITPLVVLDRDFNFIMVNHAYARAGKRDISEFDGKNHFDFYPSDAIGIFKEVVSTKTPYQAVARPFSFPGQPERETTY